MVNAREYIKKGLIYHVLVWTLLLVPHMINSTFLAKRGGLLLYFINIAFTDIPILCIIYLNVFYLIPKLFKRDNKAVYFTCIAVLIAFFICISLGLNSYIGKQLHFPREASYFVLISSFFNVSQYLVISFLLFNLKEQFEQQQKLDQVLLDKLRTEIAYLKAQINPHFLFNTLNNLYALALEKSNKSPEIILRLSKMMDYMLYDSEEPMVPLQKDIENLENYVAIERIRQGNNASIRFTIEGNISGQKIVPMLFLSLVENGFKHGINELIRDAYLTIHIAVDNDFVAIRVKNNYKPKDKQEIGQRTGIGLTNLEKRLALFYPDKYALEVLHETNTYEVYLKILFV